MTEKGCGRAELVELAEQVVEKILQDPELARAVADKTGTGPDCPPHTLCCSKNHICEGHGGFSCSPPYRCQSGFEERVAFA